MSAANRDGRLRLPHFAIIGALVYPMVVLGFVSLRRYLIVLAVVCGIAAFLDWAGERAARGEA